ncbi:MAG: hypothetical protein JNM20_18490 [Rhizobiales bacterium]|nr:hypothetical protein [Hyphomicrobiales bacterium]
MDWDFAIAANRTRLRAVVARLCAEIGLAEGAVVERLSRPAYRVALRVLRKAESAVRRLIYVAARNIVVEPRDARPPRPRNKPSTRTKTEGEARPKRKRGLLFNLFDPPRRLKDLLGRRRKRRQAEPRVHLMDGPDPRIPSFLRPQAQAPAPAPDMEVKAIVDDGTVSAVHLCRRLAAMIDALEDIPRHAMRLARWQAKPIEERRPERWSPLRSGRPPGFRQRPRHEVDEILKDCDWLARNVMPALDTS